MEFIKKLTLPSSKTVELYKISGSQNHKNILIIGVFHGEEPQGYLAIKNFINNNFSNTNIKNNVLIIPCLNPDGMAKNQRKNGNGVDLNRNFPTKNWALTEKKDDFYGGEAPSSESETQFVTDIITDINPDFILTLHSPYAIVNYDGPAQYEAEKISEFTGYPVQSDIGYPTPGSFGTYCGIERNIPTVTLEYDENENIDSIFIKSNKVFNWLIKEY